MINGAEASIYPISTLQANPSFGYSTLNSPAKVKRTPSSPPKAQSQFGEKVPWCSKYCAPGPSPIQYRTGRAERMSLSYGAAGGAWEDVIVPATGCVARSTGAAAYGVWA